MTDKVITLPKCPDWSIRLLLVPILQHNLRDPIRGVLDIQ
jgi:hypothetical protein